MKTLGPAILLLEAIVVGLAIPVAVPPVPLAEAPADAAAVRDDLQAVPTS